MFITCEKIGKVNITLTISAIHFRRNKRLFYLFFERIRTKKKISTISIISFVEYLVQFKEYL